MESRDPGIIVHMRQQFSKISLTEFRDIVKIRNLGVKNPHLGDPRGLKMAPLNSAGSTLWGLVATTVVLSATVFEIWTRKVKISIISAEKGFKVTQGHRS